MHTIVARFHHPKRDLGEIEASIVAAGAGDAHITGYTVAISVEAKSREDAVSTARTLLEDIGATHIRGVKRRAKS